MLVVWLFACHYIGTWVVSCYTHAYGHLHAGFEYMAAIICQFWSLRDGNRPHRSISSNKAIESSGGYVGPMLALCWAAMGTCLATMGRCWAYVETCWAILGPCWAWAYVGPCWPMLGLCWAMLRASSATWPILGPFQQENHPAPS